MPQHISIVSIPRAAGYGVVPLAVVAVVIFLWLVGSWLTGNMLAEQTSPASPESVEIAPLAARLAPSDPLANWLLATRAADEFSLDGVERAVVMFENVVRLSPYDFRWWIELGRANEQAERYEAAEKALSKAIELAPEYTFPKWQMGNFLLRRGRTDEAFAQLIKTTEKSSVYRDQVFALAWDFFGKDASMVERLAGDAPDMRLSLAMFYAQRGASADALRNWNMLTDEQKRIDPQVPRVIAQGLFDQRNFREAVEFARQSGIDPESHFEEITNPGFEKLIPAPEDTLFGWNVYRGDPRLDIMPDLRVWNEGARSLRITFKGYAKPELANVVQVVAVQPNTEYRVSFSVRTENLRSGGPPLLQIGNANNDTVIVSSEPFATASMDWTRISLDFRVPEGCTGIFIRTSRAYCADECPITGTLWYDDLKLERR